MDCFIYFDNCVTKDDSVVSVVNEHIPKALAAYAEPDTSLTLSGRLYSITVPPFPMYVCER